MEIMFTGATNDLTRENQETTMASGKAHYRNFLKAKTSTFSPPLDNYYSLISNQNSSQPETKPLAFSFSNCSPLKLFSFSFLSSQKPIPRETFFYSFSLSWQPENHTCTSSLLFFFFCFILLLPFNSRVSSKPTLFSFLLWLFIAQIGDLQSFSKMGTESGQLYPLDTAWRWGDQPVVRCGSPKART